MFKSLTFSLTIFLLFISFILFIGDARELSFIFFLFGLGIAYLHSKNAAKHKARETPAYPSSSPAAVAPQTPVLRHTIEPELTQNFCTTRSPKRDKTLEWIPFDQDLQWKGHLLRGGFYFTKCKEQWDLEASAIQESAKIGQPLAPSIFTASYYPTYAQILPNERATYLNWLSLMGRGQIVPDLARGYLFLYFYGLERRSLVDGDSGSGIISATRHLLEGYGPYHQGRTLIIYLSDFLHFTTYQLGPELFRQEWPRTLTAQGLKISEDSLLLILANYYETNTPLDWSLAYRLAQRHDKSRSSVVVKRTPGELISLFQYKYETLYPEGITLRASKRKKTITYHAANATLPSKIFTANGRGQIQIPNVLGIPSQFKNLPAIWNECLDELAKYSRAIKAVLEQHTPTQESELKAFLALPSSLQKTSEHPLRREFNSIKNACECLNNSSIIPCSALASLAGIQSRSTLTTKQSETVAEVIESLDHSCIPHPSHLSLPFQWEQPLLLTPHSSKTSLDSSELTGTLRLLYLTIIVAASDGDISEGEMTHFLSQLTPLELTGEQMQEIQLTITALEQDPKVALKNLNRIAKSIPEANREAVLRHLTTVAADDEIITSDEVKVLKRIAKAMKLDFTVLEQMIESITEFKTVKVISSGKQKAGEKLPVTLDSKKQSPLNLDRDRIASISQETKSIVAILSEVLSEEEVEPSVTSSAILVRQAQTEKTPDWLSDLGKIYQAPLLELLSSPNPDSSILDEICQKHHLIPSSLIDEINEWSDESLGDFLLELSPEGGLLIYKDLLPDQVYA